MKAVEKIKSEIKNAKLSRKGKAVSSAVINALSDFCRQNSEFAQAVEQSKKSVADCIESTVKNCGNSISDVDVVRKAVSFYFPGATVKCTMTIDVGDGGFSNVDAETLATAEAESKEPKKLCLELDSLLDF